MLTLLKGLTIKGASVIIGASLLHPDMPLHSLWTDKRWTRSIFFLGFDRMCLPKTQLERFSDFAKTCGSCDATVSSLAASSYAHTPYPLTGALRSRARNKIKDILCVFDDDELSVFESLESTLPPLATSAEMRLEEITPQLCLLPLSEDPTAYLDSVANRLIDQVFTSAGYKKSCVTDGRSMLSKLYSGVLKK